MRRRSSKVAALAVIVSALGLAAATMALATRTLRIASPVTITSHGQTFTGRVTASSAACRIHRRVRLYDTNNSLLLGAATTNSRGHWKITAAGFAGISLGHFVAKVRRRRAATPGTLYVCKAASSPIIAFNQ